MICAPTQAIVYGSALMSTRSTVELILIERTLYRILNAPLRVVTQKQKGPERLNGMSFSQTTQTLLYPVVRVAFNLFAYSNIMAKIHSEI